MRYEVLLTDDAQRDLADIVDHIAGSDSPVRADHVLDRLLEATASLTRFPGRGAHPDELLALGIREYRQTFFKPYRVIYRVLGKRVFVYLIADGRRDMQTLLVRRLLGA